MPLCAGCGRPFRVITADYTNRHLIMRVWALRRTYCLTCLEKEQREWSDSRWAASLGIPTVEDK